MGINQSYLGPFEKVSEPEQKCTEWKVKNQEEKKESGEAKMYVHVI